MFKWAVEMCRRKRINESRTRQNSFSKPIEISDLGENEKDTKLKRIKVKRKVISLQIEIWLTMSRNKHNKSSK